MNISPEVWQVILVIIGGLFSGGFAAWIMIPIALRKSKSEILNMDIDTAATALNVAKEATKQAQDASNQVQELRSENTQILKALEGEFVLSARFSLHDALTKGSAQVQGTVMRLNEIPVRSDS